MESRTEDESDVVLQVGKIYSDLYGRDMVEVMKGAKKIEVQLISNIQKDNILASCKELADCYKSVKNALKSLESPEPLATDYIVALLTKFQTSSASLVTTVQATSISSIAFKEFLPKIQALKNNILSLKSFFLSTRDQQLLQFKFLSKTIKLEPELHLSGQRASIHISTVRKEDEKGMVSSPNLLANRTNLVSPNSSASSVGSESSDSYYSPSSTPSMSVKTTPNSSQQITEINFPNSSLSSIRSPSTPSPKVSPSTSQNSVLSPVSSPMQSPIPASSPVGSPKISSPGTDSPSKERPPAKEKKGFLTLSPRRSSVTRTASQTNMAKAMKQAPKTGSPNTISVATGQMFKPPDVITCVDLFEAARKGDVTQAQLLRKKGLGINGIDSNGWSALHHAASLGHLDVAQYLVAEGIKLDIQDLSGMTAFDRACIQGKEDMALYLHRMGATFDPSSKIGKDVLRRSTVSKDFWHEILGEEFDKINLNTSNSGTLRRSGSVSNSPSGTPIGTPTGTLRETRVTPNAKVTSLPVITLTEDEDPTANFNKPLPIPPSQPKPPPPPKILEQLSGSPQTRSTPSILSLATPNASIEMSPTGSNNTSPNSAMLSKEIQFGDLHPLLEQFTNELTYCIKFLCYPHFSKEELDNFSEPLRTLSLLLRDILGVAKSNPDVPFKVLHETTVRLVQNVKSLYTSRSFLKEPIIESSLNVMNAVSNFYIACEGVTPQEEVLEDVQQYLFVMKQVLDPNASKDTIVTSCKSLHVKIMALFIAGLKFTNGSPMQFQKRLVTALCDLQDNAEKIVDQRYRSEIPREETKRTAALIRELIAVIKSAESTSSAFEFFTANYDNSLEVASAQIEALIQSDAGRRLPRPIISILPPLTSITKELRRMDKVNNSLDLLEACGSIVEATQSVTDVIDAYHRGGNFKDELSSKLVLDALFLLHRCTIQIKTVGCTEVLKKLKAYQNVLRLAVAALFDALKVNQTSTKDGHIAQPITASPSTELPEEDNSQASESDQHIAKLHADAAAASLEALASCKLYEFRYVDPVWKPTSISGTVALLFHKPTQDLFFQITDQATQESVFLYKVQPELGYHESSEYFHRFKSEFGYIGFSFFNIDEAKIFSAATQQMHKLYMSR